ncbi:hypothetical protein VTP01DRAFT_697 [Rhizomucor pusillus]|uniref:uncharacterized protein n=1 Tax=Rhizomucor pusillus TaxID=4840 RepID=UPI0037441017
MALKRQLTVLERFDAKVAVILIYVTKLRMKANLKSFAQAASSRKSGIASDVLPNIAFTLGSGSLRYEDPCYTPARSVQGDATNGLINSHDLEDLNFLDDAVEDVDEESLEEIDSPFKSGYITIENRCSRPELAFRGRAAIKLRCDTSPAEYSLCFLPPGVHIKD